MEQKIRNRRGFIFFIVALITIAVISTLIYQTSLNDYGIKIVPITTPTPTSTPTLNPTSTPNSTSTVISIPATTVSKPTSTTIIPPVVIPIISISSSSKLAYKFGISMGDTLPSLSTTTLDKELNDIASLGIGWIRIDMAWNDIQPYNSSTYNWAGLDRVVAAANARNIKILPILDYTPRWDRPSYCQNTPKCDPEDPALFAAFAKTVVQRYAPQGITDWEIWNEPNLNGFLQSETTAAGYVDLLKLTYTAIKSQNRAAFVISGGLGPAATADGNISPIDFLTEMYADGAKNYFDAVGFHPYSYPAMPNYYAQWNAWEQMASTTPSLRSIMVANGDTDKQIWMTEYGAPTGGPGILETSASDTRFTGHPDHVTESLQSAMLSQAIIDVENDPWAGPFFWYSYKDLGTSTSTVENYFGLIRFDGTVKPAYTTLKDLLGS